MYCKHCKVQIDYPSEKCPLCKYPLEIYDSGSHTSDSGFPKPSVRPRLFDTALFFYGLLTLIISAVCLIVNLSLNRDFLWSITVFIVLSYFYYCLKHTVIAQKNFHARIFGQVLVLTLCFIAVRVFIGGNDWLFISWLPAVYFVSVILMVLNMAIYRKNARKSIVTLILLSILAFIPLISAYVLDLSVKWPSIAAAAFAAAVMLATLIIGRKQILGELKRFFHL